AGFPGLKVFECDGTDFLDSFATMNEAVDYCRRNQSPVLVRAECIRPYSHALSDDEKLYKTPAERASEAARDPVVKFPRWLLAEGILDQHGLDRLMDDVDLEIQQAAERALKAPGPPAGSAL